jgi:hypothetical protein
MRWQLTLVPTSVRGRFDRLAGESALISALVVYKARRRQREGGF